MRTFLSRGRGGESRELRRSSQPRRLHVEPLETRDLLSGTPLLSAFQSLGQEVASLARTALTAVRQSQPVVANAVTTNLSSGTIGQTIRQAIQTARQTLAQAGIDRTWLEGVLTRNRPVVQQAGNAIHTAVTAARQELAAQGIDRAWLESVLARHPIERQQLIDAAHAVIDTIHAELANLNLSGSPAQGLLNRA